jgi:hypothetical protein
MEEIGRLRIRSWCDALRDLAMLARLKTRVSHVILDFDIRFPCPSESSDEYDDYEQYLLEDVYKVLVTGGSINLIGYSYGDEQWFWANNRATLELGLETWRQAEDMFFDGKTVRILGSDDSSDDEDFEFVPRFLPESVTAMVITDQEQIWRFVAAVRVIQRAMRVFVARTRAVRVIQRRWVERSGNPHGKLGSRVLKLRFKAHIDSVTGASPVEAGPGQAEDPEAAKRRKI